MQDPLLFYETPDWAVRVLLDRVAITGRIAEPTAGAWAVVKAATEWQKTHYPRGENQFHFSVINDIDPAHKCPYKLDAMLASTWQSFGEFEWAIGNPPYGKLGPTIVRHAVAHARSGVAMFLRATFGEVCIGRALWLEENPPTAIISVPRYSFKRGEKSKADSSPCWWYIWEKESSITGFHAVPACRIPGFYSSAEQGLKLRKMAIAA